MANAMMDHEEERLAALALRQRRGQGATTAERKKLERDPLKPTDGRRARRTGREVPTTFKFKPAVKDTLRELAEAESVAMIVIIERALELYAKRTQKQ